MAHRALAVSVTGALREIAHPHQGTARIAYARRMTICPSCGTRTPTARSSAWSARPGSMSAPPARSPRSARSSPSLFCDLVGFTATSESADPEDVDRMLAAYFAMARDADRGATAGWSRSSSATRSSASSACPPRTRTTPSGPCARGFGSPRTPRSSRRSAARRCGSASGSTPGEALVRLGRRAGLGRGAPRRRRDQHRLAPPVGRPRDGRRGRARPPTRRPRRCSTTRSSSRRR